MNVPPSPSYGPPPADTGHPPVDYGPAQSLAVPPSKPKHLTRTVLIIALAVAVVTALIIFFVHQSSSGGGSVQAPTEAIDLASQPSLGTPWNATDGNPREENLQAPLFITPCGVLVTILTTDYSHRNQGNNARIVGYEISTGTKKWEVNLKEVTGVNSPTIGYDAPTYTSNCTMVVMVSDQNGGIFAKAGLAVALSTGEAKAFYASEEIRGCAALASNRAGCWELLNQMQVVDLASGSSTTVKLNSSASGPFPGDRIVSGMIWGPQGYQDPVSGKVVFGRDADSSTWEDDWIVFVEPKQPGGFGSGVVVRVEGSIRSTGGTCSMMAWNTKTDKGLWSAPASFPCENTYQLEWTVTDSTLVVSHDSDDGVQAYSLKDGSLLWDNDTSLYSSGWSWANDSYGVGGLTGYYAIFLDEEFNQSLVRISDGTEIPFDHDRWSVQTASKTMAYARMRSSGTQHLAAFLLDGSDDPLWTVDLPEDESFWTFATGGTMYVVYGGFEDPAWVVPLIE